jgi:hypothetical protein
VLPLELLLVFIIKKRLPSFFPSAFIDPSARAAAAAGLGFRV